MKYVHKTKEFDSLVEESNSVNGFISKTSLKCSRNDQFLQTCVLMCGLAYPFVYSVIVPFKCRIYFLDRAVPKTLEPTPCEDSLADTVVISVCGPEANDGVGDCGSIDWGEAGYSRQDHSILHAVVAFGKEMKQRFRTLNSHVWLLCCFFFFFYFI